MRVEYEATDDPNVFMKLTIRDSMVSLVALQKEIETLSTLIEGLPRPKTEPDQETLEFWNAMQVDQIEREGLLKQRDEKARLIEQLEAIRNGENNHMDSPI